MKRKTFIQMGSLFAASPLLPSLSDYPFQDRLQNWAGNITYSTNRVFYPKTLSEMQSQVKQCDRMRGLARGIASTPLPTAATTSFHPIR